MLPECHSCREGKSELKEEINNGLYMFLNPVRFYDQNTIVLSYFRALRFILNLEKVYPILGDIVVGLICCPLERSCVR